MRRNAVLVGGEPFPISTEGWGSWVTAQDTIISYDIHRAIGDKALFLREMCTRRIAVFFVLSLALVGCVKVQVIKHDPYRAAEDAAVTLELMFFDEDYEAARATADESFRNATTTQGMSSLVDQFSAGLGPMKELRAEAYKPMNGQKAITLFFEGTHERGTSYYRVVVTGDSGGYRVFSIESSVKPFPEAQESEVRGFDNPIVTAR